jgi:hypothetical protein
MRTLACLAATAGVVLLTSAEVCAQAGLYKPFPRPGVFKPPVPGGGVRRVPAEGGVHHVPVHVPVHAPVHGDREIGSLDFWWPVLAAIAVIILAVVGWKIGTAIDREKSRAPGGTPESPTPDLIRSPAEVASKTQQTTRLMDCLAYRDHLFDPSSLREWTARTFCLVQKCWQERKYDPLNGLLMPGIIAKHQGLLQTLRGNQEINRIEELRIERLDFVHLYCSHKADQQEFTALITFKARIYFVDDHTNAHTRGPREPRRFQEFWVFRRLGDNWKLQAIEQSRESERLESENQVVEMTKEQLHNAQHCIAL